MEDITRTFKFSKEHREKIRLSRLGKHWSDETKQKMRLAKLGKPGTTKGKHWKIKDTSNMQNRTTFLGKKHTLKTKRQIKRALLKKWRDSEFKECFRKIMQLAKSEHPQMHPKGDKHWNWQGGIAKKRGHSSSVEHAAWRKKVLERDNLTCQKYKTKSKRLEVHHIKNAAQHPNLLYDINNGIVLSYRAHRKFHNKFGFKNNNLQQLKIFLNS